MNADQAAHTHALPRNTTPRRAVGAAIALAGLAILIGHGWPPA